MGQNSDFAQSYLRFHVGSTNVHIKLYSFTFIDSTGLNYIMFTSRVYKLNEYIIPGPPLKIAKYKVICVELFPY